MLCYKYLLSVLFFICSTVFEKTALAQDAIVTKKKITGVNATPSDSLPEANALVYQPSGYQQIMHPPDEISNATHRITDSDVVILRMLTAEERAEQRRRNPYLVFRAPVMFKKADVFIGYEIAAINLSAYYKYSLGMFSIEEQRQKYNSQFVHYPERYGLGNSYTQLQDVEDAALKLINVDSAFIYNTHHKFRFGADSVQYGSMVVNLIKFDLARVHLTYYYPVGKEKKVLKEINDTWGTIRFKPDHLFTHPDRSTHIPRPKQPDLYFGKFSFINNPEQFRRDSLLFESKSR